jgi:hypothetical protein
MADTKTITTSQGLKRNSKTTKDSSVMICCSIWSVELTMLSALTSAWRRAFCKVS